MGYGSINRLSFLRSCSSFGLAWWSHALGRMFAVSLLAISVFWHFRILISYAAEGIQKCEHDHDYEHIRQSSALSVVTELSDIEPIELSPYFSSFTTIHAYYRVPFSSSSIATPCPYSAS